MNVDGYSSRAAGSAARRSCRSSLAKMAQLTQAFPDKSFSGIGGIADFAHALNYFLLGCGTVQVCTAAMLDHAIGPNVIKTPDLGHGGSRWRSTAGRRSRISAARCAIASSPTRRSGARGEGLSRRLRGRRLRLQQPGGLQEPAMPGLRRA